MPAHILLSLGSRCVSHFDGVDKLSRVELMVVSQEAVSLFLTRWVKVCRGPAKRKKSCRALAGTCRRGDLGVAKKAGGNAKAQTGHKRHKALIHQRSFLTEF